MTRLATDSEGVLTSNSKANIGVVGCCGRVGSLIVKEIQSGHWGNNIKLAGGTIRPGYPNNSDFYVSEDPDDIFERSDIIIDFTTPEATAKHIWLAAKHHKPIVIGTTGLNDTQRSELKDAAKETAIVYAANMSVGVNLLLALVENAAKRLGEDWDIEITETHHKHKLDAPSGTALALGDAAALARETKIKPNLDRNGERKRGEIGFSSQRGGDVVGEHTVSFFGEGERIELTHIASNRALFAKGALRAAIWVKDQKYGLYSMRDVLEI
jgi:4-hydroxy-tetrahydrodipicolinate reductase